MKKRNIECLNSVQGIVILLMFFCGVAVGQNSEVSFDTSFQIIGSKTIDANKLVLLKGTGVADILKLKVYCTTAGLQRQEYKNVQIKEKNWNVLVGPFPQKQNILLEFEIERKISQKESEEIKAKALESALNAFSKMFYKLPYSMNPDDLIPTIQQLLGELLSPALNDYKDETGVSVKESLINRITAKSIPKTIDFLNANLSVMEAQLEKFHMTVAALIKNAKKDIPTSDSSDLLILNEINKLEDSQINESVTARLSNAGNKAMLNNIIAQFDSINLKFKTIIRGELQKMILTRSETIRINDLKSDVLNTNIKDYIGIDIMPTLYGNNRPGTFGLFLTFSPYFGKIDPDEALLDRALFKYRDPMTKEADWEKRFFNSLRRTVTPTVGLGLVNSPADTALNKFMAFAGVSIRMNKLIRFSFGKTFYSAKVAPKILLSSWTYGISIDVEYLADVLKIVSSTTKQFYQ